MSNRMTDQRSANPRAGFTLVESVVAMLVAAMAFAGVYQLYGGAARLERAATQTAEMTRIAESLLATLPTYEIGGEEGGETGDYAWTVSGTGDPEGLDLVRVTVIVTAPDGRQVRLVTDRPIPATADEG